ncbi:MAG: hypothetical protein RIR48_3469 [Bacteroidota bacterium]|jgi:hypothetical protein
MEHQSLYTFIKDLAYSGKDYDTIKKELESHNGTFSQEAIDVAKSKIDECIVDFQLANIVRLDGRNHMIIGLILFIIGNGITLYTFFSGNSGFVLVYGAILFGAAEFYYGYKIFRTPIEELVPRKNKFQKGGIFKKH